MRIIICVVNFAGFNVRSVVREVYISRTSYIRGFRVFKFANARHSGDTAVIGYSRISHSLRLSFTF